MAVGAAGSGGGGGQVEKMVSDAKPAGEMSSAADTKERLGDMLQRQMEHQEVTLTHEMNSNIEKSTHSSSKSNCSNVGSAG